MSQVIPVYTVLYNYHGVDYSVVKIFSTLEKASRFIFEQESIEYNNLHHPKKLTYNQLTFVTINNDGDIEKKCDENTFNICIFNGDDFINLCTCLQDTEYISSFVIVKQNVE